MTYDEVVKTTPKGWKSLIDKLHLYFDVLKLDVIITDVKVERGLLRVSVDSGNTLVKDIAQRLANSLVTDSASICIECGQQGYRRNTSQKIPFCTEHYIEWCNANLQPDLERHDK